ncbi:radical SAM protein [bacterium]|nr:radical SAM protein [bacterium]
MTRHLYIHIPFCKSICTYCDFVRIKSSNHTLHKQYLDLILNQIKQESIFNQYETIYIGGGTPNALSNINLNYLLQTLNLYLDKKGLYEFCIELNPELVTLKQIEILKKNNVNRVSLGVQTTNDQINLLLHRYSSMKDVNQTID